MNCPETGLVRGDDRGSLPAAMLLVLVGVTLSALLTNLVVSSVKTSDFDARRVLALHAAQAGLDVGLAQMRGAVTGAKNDDGDDVGDLTKLPCTPMSGYVDSRRTESYTVTPVYYQTDPQQMSSSDLVTKALTCTAGTGTNKTPGFVRFTSTGTVTRGATSSRTLNGTYIVHTTNANIAGGQIRVYRANTTLNDLCIAAGADDPAAGSAATVQTCSAGNATQVWAYTDTLQIQLVSSQTPAVHPNGMCLDAGPSQSHAIGIQVVMQQCLSSKPALYQQAWSFNDSANLVGSKYDGSNTDSFCFNVASPNNSGSAIILTKTCNGGYDNIQTFSADATIGAGAASSATGRAIGQLVNYNQFGRCLDDTGQNTDATFMIAWPCKQNPNATLVTWNQRYALPALPSVATPALNATSNNKVTGTITMTKTTVYCLQSPQDTAVGKYVTTKACTGAANQNWTVYGRTDLYATSYIITDSTGYCLTPRDPKLATPDLYQAVNKISKIYVNRCDGSTLQKWNGNKNVIEALALKDLNEN